MIIPSPYKEKHNSYLENYQETGETKIIGVGRELEVVRKNGTSIKGKLWVTAKKDGDNEFFTGVFVSND